MLITRQEETIKTRSRLVADNLILLPAIGTAGNLQIGKFDRDGNDMHDRIYHQFGYLEYHGRSNTVRFDQVHGPVSNGSESYCRDVGQVNPSLESENGKSED